jgi:hypothetical protein
MTTEVAQAQVLRNHPTVAVKHKPVSISLGHETLDALRETAARKGISASKIAQEAIAAHLRALARENIEGSEPLVRVIPKHLPPSDWRASPTSNATSVVGSEVRGTNVAPPEIKPARREYTIGAAICVFEERPWSERMFEQFERLVACEIALLWAEERERVKRYEAEMRDEDS